MDRERKPEEASDSSQEPDEGPAPTDAEADAAKEAESNLLAKIEMNVFGHP